MTISCWNTIDELWRQGARVRRGAALVVLAVFPCAAQTSRSSRSVSYVPNTALAFHIPISVCTRTATVGTRLVSDAQLLYPDDSDPPPLPRRSTALLEVESIPDSGAYPIRFRVVSLTIRGREYRLSDTHASPDPEHFSSMHHLASGAPAGRCVDAGTVLMGDLRDTIVIDRP